MSETRVERRPANCGFEMTRRSRLVDGQWLQGPWVMEPQRTPYEPVPEQLPAMGRRRTILAQQQVEKELAAQVSNAPADGDAEYASWATGSGHAVGVVFVRNGVRNPDIHGDPAFTKEAEVRGDAIIADAIKHTCDRCHRVFPKGGLHLHKRHCKA